MIMFLPWCSFCALAFAIAISLSASLEPFPTTEKTKTSNASQLSNTSSAIAPFDYPIPLPYSFDVPNSEIRLQLGFGWRRRSLDPMDLQGLIVFLLHFIDEVIKEFGPGQLVRVQANGMQRVDYELGDGIEFAVQNCRPGEYFTWDTLRDVVEGLRLYLIEGQRYRQTYFKFYDWPFRGSVALGAGRIRGRETATSDVDDA